MRKLKMFILFSITLLVCIMVILKIKERAIVKELDIKLVIIPSGSFQMGSVEGYDHEKPVHYVDITSFKLMETEVTWSMFQPCIDAGMCPNNDEHGGDVNWGKGNRPVINVSWDDVQIYIKWLNQQSGMAFRLPSEAEWEYAARAGSTTKYSWGDKVDCTKASYDGGKNSSCYLYPDGKFKGTKPVKSYVANQFGLYDMHGNVWEWIQDCYNFGYEGAPNNGSAWSTGKCSRHMVRGGAWSSKPNFIRSTFRSRITFERGTDYGFRLAHDL